jgi:SAM-dependent methyltransferase
MISYREFLARLRETYEPFSYEIEQHCSLYGRGKKQNWAVRHSKRFYWLYKMMAPYLRDGMTVLDLGAFPGSYLKIMRLFYGNRLRLIGAGLPVQADFPHDLSTLGIEYYPCDLDKVMMSSYPKTLGIGEGTVNLVVCTEMIEHLYNVTQLIREINRVLAPSGLVYFSTNNVSYLPGLLRLIVGETNLDINLESTSALTESEWRGHVRFYSLSQLSGLIQQYGFEVIKRGYHQYRSPREVFVPSAQLRWLVTRVLDIIVAPLPLYRSHIYVMGRKT